MWRTRNIPYSGSHTDAHFAGDSRDPRFDSLSGKLDTDRFRKRYAFLYDEQLPAEREEIKNTLQVWVCKKIVGT